MNCMWIRGSLAALLSILVLSCSGTTVRTEGGVLVDSAWLALHAGDPGLLLFHSGDRDGYDSLHLPGARFLDPEAFYEEVDGVSVELPSLETLDSLLEVLEIGPGTTVVLYPQDRSYMNRTARVYFTLDYLGFGEQTKMLNGGLQAWNGVETETATVPGSGTQTGIHARPDSSRVVRATEVLALRGNARFRLLDARSFSEYLGEIDSATQVADGGHIEGALSLPYTNFLKDEESSFFLENDQLAAQFQDAGFRDNDQLVLYCGSGMRASVSYLVAAHLGLRPILYDGSMGDWEDRGLPLVEPVPPDMIQEKRDR